MSGRFLKFCAVGAAGFLVITGIVLLLTGWFGLGPLVAWLLGFPLAVVVTWYLNRAWGFADRKSVSAGREYLRYNVVQMVGVAANFLAYSAAILFGPAIMADFLPIPLAIGSFVALLLNYFGAKRWVYVGDAVTPRDHG